MVRSMGDDWRVRIALVDLPRELTDDQVYARGYPASPQEIAAAAAVHADLLQTGSVYGSFVLSFN